MKQKGFVEDKVSGMYKPRVVWFKGQTTKANAVGYCHSNSHRGYLTPALIKEHKCVEKECKFFSKYQDCVYWKQKEKSKAVKKKEQLFKKILEGAIAHNGCVWVNGTMYDLRPKSRKGNKKRLVLGSKQLEGAVKNLITTTGIDSMENVEFKN